MAGFGNRFVQATDRMKTKKRFHMYWSPMYRAWRVIDRDKLSEYIGFKTPSEALQYAMSMSDKWDAYYAQGNKRTY
jgi:hypothetical protein